MTIDKLIKKDIDEIISLLIEAGLCDDQNFTSITECNGIKCITFDKNCDLSTPLKNIEYDYIYEELNKNRQYTMKFADGNLVQLMYKIENGEIASHRLAVFPSRNLEPFQNETELYSCDCIYADILKKNIVSVPIRFDYASEELPNHPYSHMSLGQYKNCRIPVYGPVMPKTFIKFILKSFYNTFYKEKCINMLDDSFENIYTIRDSEKKDLHFFIS